MTKDSNSEVTMVPVPLSGLAACAKAGRPSKYKPETVARLLSAIAAGLTVRQACVASGIGESTLADWKKEHAGLGIKLEKAREQCRQKALAAIQAAGDRDWRATEAFLKLSFFRDYKPGANTTVEVSAQAGTVVVSDEQRQRLIELREQALAEESETVVARPEDRRLTEAERDQLREGYILAQDTAPAPQPAPAPVQPEPHQGMTDRQRMDAYRRAEDDFVDPYRAD